MSKSLLEAVKQYIEEKKKPIKSQAGKYGSGTQKTLKGNKSYQDIVASLDQEEGE